MIRSLSTHIDARVYAWLISLVVLQSLIDSGLCFSPEGFSSNRIYEGHVDGVESMKELSRAIQLPQVNTLKMLQYFEAPNVYLNSDFSPLESVNFLRDSCGIKRAHVHEMIKRHPKLTACLLMRIHASNPPLQSSLAVVREYVGENGVQMVVKENMGVFRTATRNNIRAKLAFLHNHPSIQASSKDISRLLIKNPELFSYSMTNIRDVTNFLFDYVEMNGDDVWKVMTKAPVLFSYSVKENLLPTLEYFQGPLVKFRMSEIRSMVRAYPPFLFHSNETQLEDVRLLMNDIFEGDQNDIARISMLEPIIWNLSINLLKDRVIFLVEIMELTLVELQSLVSNFPKLLTLQVESNLQPTFRFFLEHIREKEELREYVLECPPVVACSLETRLRPRCNEMNTVLGIELVQTPAYIMLLNEKKFSEWIEKVREMTALD